jgi:hypothetical protein
VNGRGDRIEKHGASAKKWGSSVIASAVRSAGLRAKRAASAGVVVTESMV